MGKARYLWLLVPLLGLGELGAHGYFSQRAPTLGQWQALKPALERFKKPDELVLITPEWAEPLARGALGDALLPTSMLARPDASGYRTAVEVSTLASRAEETDGWRETARQQEGAFVLRRLENPKYTPVLYRFADHVRPPELAVTEGSPPAECAFNDRASVVTGGLHGPVAYPRERYACSGGGAFFVGVTIIDDQNYRPRRCIWAHPTLHGNLALHFANVPLGKRIRGYAGLSYFLFRDGAGTPVELTVRIGDQQLGRHVHHDESGWQGFEFSTGALAGTKADVDISIESQSPERRDFCFYAESL